MERHEIDKITHLFVSEKLERLYHAMKDVADTLLEARYSEDADVKEAVRYAFKVEHALVKELHKKMALLSEWE